MQSSPREGSVDEDVTVPLKILQGIFEQRSEDSVDASWIETELSEKNLKFCDVVTAKIWTRKIEEAITQTPTGLHES